MKEHINLKSLFLEHQNDLAKVKGTYEKMREHIATFSFEEFEKVDNDSYFSYNKAGEFLGINVNNPETEYMVPTEDCCGIDLLSMYFYTIYEELIAWTDELSAFNKEYDFSMEQAHESVMEQKKKDIPEELRNFKPSQN